MKAAIVGSLGVERNQDVSIFAGERRKGPRTGSTTNELVSSNNPSCSLNEVLLFRFTAPVTVSLGGVAELLI